MIRNLGRVLTILARAEAAEHFMHADVDAWGAPGECHALVARGEGRRSRRVRKQVESEARAPYRIIRRQAEARGMPLGGPRWQSFVSRIYERTYPF
jgi:hypothetical protein